MNTLKEWFKGSLVYKIFFKNIVDGIVLLCIVGVVFAVAYVQIGNHKTQTEDKKDISHSENATHRPRPPRPCLPCEPCPECICPECICPECICPECICPECEPCKNIDEAVIKNYLYRKYQEDEIYIIK